ncbi:MAG: GFA family protein [Cycloclasticus sp.]
MNKQTGQCLCGSIQYEISEAPIITAACHCSHCQKASGSAYSLNICVAESGFSIHGETQRCYVDQGDSGLAVKRYFCHQCGSPLYTQADAMPGIMIVKAGTLDDTSGFKPAANIWCDSRMAWLTQEQKILDFAKMPPS